MIFVVGMENDVVYALCVSVNSQRIKIFRTLNPV